MHLEITKHSEGQHHIVKAFIKLDEKREAYIQEAINLCKSNEPFTTTAINAVTKEMNNLGKRGIVTSLPVRKFVTEQMVRDYVAKSTT